MTEKREQDLNENVNVDELVQEAERRFRQGVKAINEYGAHARTIIQKKPGAVLAGVAVLGFVTGLALRKLAMSDLEGELK